MTHPNRREFLAAAAGLASSPRERLSFYLVGDTHYLANAARTSELSPISRGHTSRLLDWLNRLPGTDIPAAAGGGSVLAPRGLIHAGDMIDSGDRTGPAYLAMQKTEWRCFEEDFGLTGKDGKLSCPVYEVHGNHDAPRGEGLVIDAMKRRNKRRPGLVNLSANGLHYSWDWGKAHFVNLGIVVGSAENVKRRRRYPPLDSLPFLIDDLRKNVKDGRQPVILTHHVDVARYSDACDPEAAPRGQEWDPCDVRAYHDAIKGYNVVGVMYGHTHARNVFRWDGTKAKKKEAGVPVFNTDNASHFKEKPQALMYCEMTEKELVVREFATPDGWQTGRWTTQVWRVPLARG